jgi:hypothetical protein
MNHLAETRLAKAQLAVYSTLPPASIMSIVEWQKYCFGHPSLDMIQRVMASRPIIRPLTPAADVQ